MVLQLCTMSLLITQFLQVQPKYTWSKKDVGSLKSTSLFNTFHIGSSFCFYPANFTSSTCTEKKNPFSRCTKRHSQFRIFSHPCFNETFSNCLSHNSPAKRWPYRFRSRGMTGSSILDHDFGHLCRGKRIQMSGHSDFGILKNLWTSSIFTWVWTDTASAACPSQPGKLEMISMILAAVIWDTEDPCSVNTAWDPELSFTISPRSTTRPLYFWCFTSIQHFSDDIFPSVMQNEL